MKRGESAKNKPKTKSDKTSYENSETGGAAVMPTNEAKFFLAAIVESSNDSIVTVDFAGEITSWNRGAERLYGYPAREAIGKPLMMLALPEDLAEVFGRIEEVKQNRRVEIYDTVRVHQDGRLMTLEIFLSPVKDDKGQIIGVSTIARDVTQQRKAEVALRESEEKYRHVFNAIDEGLCIVEMLFDADNKPYDYLFLEVNPVFERMNGVDNALGKTTYQLIPNLEPFWVETLGRIALTGESERFERYSAAMNRSFDVHASRTGDAASRHVAIVFNDISTRKRTEANLAFLAEISQDLANLTNIDQTMNALGAKLAAQFNLSACAFAELDKAADIAYINHGWHRADVPSLLGTYRMEEFMTAEVVQDCRAGKAVVVRDVFADPRFDGEQYATLNIGSFVSIPLVRGGKWRFLLVVFRTKPSDWTKDEIELLRELTNRIWTRLERARAEEALQTSEERLRALIKNLPGGAVFVLNKELRYIVAEGEALTEGGLTSKELIGKTIFEALPEELAADYEPRLRQALAGEGFEVEHEAHGHYYVSRGVPLINSGEINAVLAVSYDITARKLAEEALAESEKKYRNLFESIDEGFCIIEVLFDEKGKPSDWRYKEVNPAFERHSRIPDAKGRLISELVEFVEPKWLEIYGRVALTGEPVRVEDYTVVVGGWLNLYAFSVGDSSENCVAVVFSDITTRKRAEAELRQSEERLQKAISIETVGVLFFTLDGRITDANEAFLRMSGYTREELLQITDWSLLTEPAYLPITARTAENLAANGKTPPYEKVMIRRDGSRWCGMFAPTRLRGSGLDSECVEFIVDITEAKRAEQFLRQSEERLRLLIESASDYAIFTMTRDGLIESWNTGAEKMFGWTEREVIGKSAEIIYTPEDNQKNVPQREIKTALKKGHAPDERFHMRRDGSRFYVSGVLTMIKDASGNFQGFVKIARDMTETIENQKILRDKEMLQKLVGALEDERRRIARDLHDELGQQLTALRLKLDKTRKQCGDDEICAAIDEIQLLAGSIDEGVDFLAWELRPAALDQFGLIPALENYIKQWTLHSGVPAELLASSLKKKRLAPEVEINLYRIVQESLNNIHKHARAKSVIVMLEKRDDLIVLIIEDDGKGFNVKDKKKRSTGIGLIGMQERAELIQGKLEIESAPGEGSTIFVRVPIKKVKKK